MTIERALASLNINPREAAIYMASLELWPSTVQEIANKLKQNRITVHSAIDQLIAKGLLYESRKGKRRLIVPEKPDALHKIVRKRQHELNTLEHSLKNATKLLSSIHSSTGNVPSVKIYEDVSGFKRMLEDTLNAKSEVLVFSNVALLAELVGANYLENYFKLRAHNEIHTRLIFPPGEFAARVNKKAAQYNIEVRYLPPEFKWQSGIFAWDDYIAILSYTGKKLTCTIIENENIAQFYRDVIFKLCWQNAKT
ncbi:MAG: helix-turn-helix domain-containing protein [bacterium]|nr:helix-turn-helix domain-containing protein [bacterium]